MQAITCTINPRSGREEWDLYSNSSCILKSSSKSIGFLARDIRANGKMFVERKACFPELARRQDYSSRYQDFPLILCLKAGHDSFERLMLSMNLCWTWRPRWEIVSWLLTICVLASLVTSSALQHSDEPSMSSWQSVFQIYWQSE